MTYMDAYPGMCDCGQITGTFCKLRSEVKVDYMPKWRRSAHVLVGHHSIDATTYGAVTLQVSAGCRQRILETESPWAQESP